MSTSYLMVMLLISVVLIVVMVAKLHQHGFIAMVVATFFLGLSTGMPLTDIVAKIEQGVGGTLGFIALIIGLGSILGKLLEESGGAKRIAFTLLNKMGKKNATWVMMLVGYTTGIPVFADVGFIIMVPLVFVIAKETGMSKMLIGVPLALSLMVIHCIVPPHPAATAISITLGADIGKVILYGIIVGLPATIIGGPLYMNFFCRNELAALKDSGRSCLSGGQTTSTGEESLPSFSLTLFTILLPLILMVGNTVICHILPKESSVVSIITFIGNPITALLISVVFASWSLILRRGGELKKLLELTNSSFIPIAGIILIIGAGGGFNQIIIASGIGKGLAGSFATLPINPVIFAWLISCLMHFAVGSATVAMISAAGLVLPMLQADPSLSPEIMVLAIGTGTIGGTHVTDSLFWMAREYFGLSLTQAYKSYTGATTIASLVGLGITLLLDAFIF